LASLQDVKEKLFGMSETATAMSRIRARDTQFDMSTLLKVRSLTPPGGAVGQGEQDQPADDGCCSTGQDELSCIYRLAFYMMPAQPTPQPQLVKLVVH
jgi:hypothetical protein